MPIVLMFRDLRLLQDLVRSVLRRDKDTVLPIKIAADRLTAVTSHYNIILTWDWKDDTEPRGRHDVLRTDPTP